MSLETTDMPAPDSACLARAGIALPLAASSALDSIGAATRTPFRSRSAFTVHSRVPVDLRQWTRRSGFTNNPMSNSAIVEVPRTRNRPAPRGRGEPRRGTNSAPAPARRYRLRRQPVFSIGDGCKHTTIRMISPFASKLSLLQRARRSRHETR